MFITSLHRYLFFTLLLKFAKSDDSDCLVPISSGNWSILTHNIESYFINIEKYKNTYFVSNYKDFFVRVGTCYENTTCSFVTTPSRILQETLKNQDMEKVLQVESYDKGMAEIYTLSFFIDNPLNTSLYFDVFEKVEYSVGHFYDSKNSVLYVWDSVNPVLQLLHSEKADVFNSSLNSEQYVNFTTSGLTFHILEHFIEDSWKTDKNFLFLTKDGTGYYPFAYEVELNKIINTNALMWCNDLSSFLSKYMNIIIIVSAVIVLVVIVVIITICCIRRRKAKQEQFRFLWIASGSKDAPKEHKQEILNQTNQDDQELQDLHIYAVPESSHEKLYDLSGRRVQPFSDDTSYLKPVEPKASYDYVYMER